MDNIISRILEEGFLDGEGARRSGYEFFPFYQNDNISVRSRISRDIVFPFYDEYFFVSCCTLGSIFYNIDSDLVSLLIY